MIDISPSERPVAGTIVLLHGWGANSRDVVPIAQSLRLRNIRYVIPEARVEVPGTGGMGKGWFTIPEMESSGAELKESIEQISGVLDTLSRNGTRPENTVLMGFSQGASLCLDVALSYPKNVAGIVSLSGFVVPALHDRIREASAETLPVDMPVFAGHGRLDAVVPLGTGKASFEVLREKGFAVEWHEYEAGHHIVAEELEDIRMFLTGVFSQAA